MGPDKETIPKLPFDIIFLVVDSFALLPDERGREALLSLSLTCRSLQPICQRYIFATISLRPRICDLSWSKLTKPDNDDDVRSIALSHMEGVLESNPGIADHVRTLHYHWHKSSSRDSGAATLLSKLTRIEELVITPYFDYDGAIEGDVDVAPLDWEMLPSLPQQALGKIIRLPSLHTLKLEEVAKFPLDMLLPCTNLHTLHLVYSQVLPVSPRPSNYDITFRLQSITLHPRARSNVQALLHRRPDGLPYFDLSQLRYLMIDMDRPGDGRQLDGLLEGLDRLEVLKIYFLPQDLEDLARIITIRATSLQNLQHVFLCEGHESWDELHVPTLALFKQFPTLRHLETLVLIFRAYDSNDIHTFDDLRQLAMRLSTPSFGSLRSVTLHVSLFGYVPAMYKDWRTRALTHMASLDNNPALDLEFTVD